MYSAYNNGPYDVILSPSKAYYNASKRAAFAFQNERSYRQQDSNGAFELRYSGRQLYRPKNYVYYNSYLAPPMYVQPVTPCVLGYGQTPYENSRATNGKPKEAPFPCWLPPRPMEMAEIDICSLKSTTEIKETISAKSDEFQSTSKSSQTQIFIRKNSLKKIKRTRRRDKNGPEVMVRDQILSLFKRQAAIGAKDMPSLSSSSDDTEQISEKNLSGSSKESNTSATLVQKTLTSNNSLTALSLKLESKTRLQTDAIESIAIIKLTSTSDDDEIIIKQEALTKQTTLDSDDEITTNATASETTEAGQSDINNIINRQRKVCKPNERERRKPIRPAARQLERLSKEGLLIKRRILLNRSSSKTSHSIKPPANKKTAEIPETKLLFKKHALVNDKPETVKTKEEVRCIAIKEKMIDKECKERVSFEIRAVEKSLNQVKEALSENDRKSVKDLNVEKQKSVRSTQTTQTQVNTNNKSRNNCDQIKFVKTSQKKPVQKPFKRIKSTSPRYMERKSSTHSVHSSSVNDSDNITICLPPATSILPGILVKHDLRCNNNASLFESMNFLLLSGDENGIDVQNMRKIVADEIAADLCLYNTSILGKSNGEYCEWIQQPESPGGVIELYVLSHYYCMEIDVVDTRFGQIRQFGDDRKYLLRTLLFYDGYKFEPLYMSTGRDEAPITIFPVEEEIVFSQAKRLVRAMKYFPRYLNRKVNMMPWRCMDCRMNLDGKEQVEQHSLMTGHNNYSVI